ncbi:P-loop containing nucleoside triphosphate hydrolase protein [Crepidotus variabilis]|uniref:ATP-dependent DNA helicase n=1 Tax=Crepidotus variabilis TaxID=179855 RepID=A0A9P6EAI9_9AGAR|nr:P-loop containing nucleoside triphosphate hydrolase protein [Crepidotus variabilis]
MSVGTKVSAEEACLRVLKDVFGHSDYKGKQKEIVEAAYEGSDVLVVAPTGMGKSLCFQVPAVATQRGVSVVISPLLALMQNQLESLQQKHVEVAALNSQVTHQEKQQICVDLQDYDTRIKLLYVTPEKMSKQDFIKVLDVVYENNNLARLVVDEAHCISEWGHNFRAEYRLLGKFRERYPNIPIMALTATATSAVQRDIIQSLRLNKSNLFTALHPFNRANLFYEVRYLSNPEPLNQMNEIFDYITTLYRRRGKASSGVIYCRLRKTCDELSKYLRSKGLNSKPYHRGLPSSILDSTLKSWIHGVAGEGGTVDVVVATIAFGLGIDKGDVRYIIHFDMPKSFEGYYQETGRAGRDGQPSKCILYYSREDAIRVKRYVHSDPDKQRDNHDDEPTPTQRASGSLDSLIQFAESPTMCRHVAICHFFGEIIDDSDQEVLRSYCNQMCDVCKYPEKTNMRIKKLTSKDLAASNVPFARTTSYSNGVPLPRNVPLESNSNENQWPVRSRNSFGGQKRGNEAVTENGGGSAVDKPVTMKKPKIFGPTLVTRPFGSAAGLSKPFRPPTYTPRASSAGTSASAGTLNPQQLPASRQERRTQLPSFKDLPSQSAPNIASMSRSIQQEEFDHEEHEHPDMDENEPTTNDRESSPIDVPHVDMSWEPEHSAKAIYNVRFKMFKSLRGTLHKTLTPTFGSEPIWQKISSRMLDDVERARIIFQTSKAIESNALLLSSTLQGYLDRIESRKEDIKALSKLEMWDSDDGKEDFEESQEIVQILRVSVVELFGEKDVRPSGKGKKRGW